MNIIEKYTELGYSLPLDDEELLILGEIISNFIYDRETVGENIIEPLIEYAAKGKYQTSEVKILRRYFTTTETEFDELELSVISKITRNYLRDQGEDFIVEYLAWLIKEEGNQVTEVVPTDFNLAAKYFSTDYEDYLEIIKVYENSEL